eukprot:TRINITY_DN68694_c0_g1_i1.p1 TRINITY_DN68694_c0_g1~~TRINITY_DN68694_c0_g1_i1.p1  ORF type:complete len:371 (+),score=86.79 TRINITY_DN68694_c0_g1_i1:182-1294(+)
MSDDEEIDEDELRADYEEKCNDVVELKAELRAAKIEAQGLRLRLQAAAKKGGDGALAGAGGAGPVGMPAATLAAPPPPQQMPGQEMRPTISWLAEHVALDQPPEMLDVGFEVPIGGRTVLLPKVAQWPLTLPPPASRLRLSVPVEEHEAVASFLGAAKARSNNPEPQALAAFAAHWELVPGELTTATHARPEPAVALAHRFSANGILIATWPTREALDAFRALHSTDGEVPSVGDRVEVEFEGSWYAGVLATIDTVGKASVQCDADEQGVFTLAPLHRIKLLSRNASAETAAADAASIDGGCVGPASDGGGAASEAGSPSTSGTGAVGAADKTDALRMRFQTEDAAAGNGTVATRPAPHRRTRSEPGPKP